MLGFDPAVHRVLHVEHGASVGTATHSAEGNAQGIGHGVGQTTIGTRRQIEKMDAAVEQELFKLSGGGTARAGIERIVLEEAITEQPVAFEHTPSEQGSHVEGTHPCPLQDVIRQVKPQFGPAQPLGLEDEIGVVLKR